ncbi:UNVERIFIED_CONTAM: protein STRICTOSIDINE SYNTHASE-LIKE 5 [Sesamum angustifolium]|uniref:Protein STRICTOSIDINE SYNTHASE-LIKE 5 n=1 Tax=Sesamum angustifolium TaxID=2727405 RepID=A0AAW2JBE8_9LAMI
MAKVTPVSAILILLLPVVVAVFLYQLDRFDPAPYPEQELTQKEPPLFVPKRNSHMLRGSEKIGYGQLPAPEDIAYDAKTGAIYTGCEDGWVNRVVLNASAGDPVVENWVNTGGRPLGIVHGLHGEVMVADADKGLLNISRDGVIELLTDEAEGVKFKLTDAVDIGPDGKLYFTDASYKYSFREYFLDLLEGRPMADSWLMIHLQKKQKSWRRCKKYYIQGPRKGTADTFIEDLPGLPDNIRYDGDGHYWIALSTEANLWKLLQRYPFVRKVIVIVERYIGRPNTEKNGGLIAIDLDGKPTAHYYDRDMFLVSSGVKIGEHLYCGSIVFPYITRLNVSQYPATPAA